MKGILRSWKLCGISPEVINGVPGWRKWRLRRAAWLIPSGNYFLKALDAGCVMVGAGWAEHEAEVFRRAHGDEAAATCQDGKTIWLPHLPGFELRHSPTRQGALLAFGELGRFHRLAERSIHGDPHAGNFLYDPESTRCRIIDFETTVPEEMDPPRGRARDFAILALDLWQRGNFSPQDFRSWESAYGPDSTYCPLGSLLRDPGRRLQLYWRLLGYRTTGMVQGLAET